MLLFTQNLAVAGSSIPLTEPVTLADMRMHIGIGQADDTSRDEIISARIAAAREYVENYLQKRLITQTVIDYCDAFPRQFVLIGPLQSVTAVRYVDADGALQVLPSADYYVNTRRGLVVPAFGKAWPGTRAQMDAVQIEYVTGFGDFASDVPQSIKEAIMFIVSQWEVFQSSIEGVIRPMTVPNAAKQLLEPHRDYREMF